MNILLALLCCNTCGLLNNELSDNSSPKVVIVGAGPAGIAAATRLLDNGFTDITILEAENRIGGRLYGMKFGDYMIDMGGQWIHGENNNVAFELAWPLGLVERMAENFVPEIKYFKSSGLSLSPNIVRYIRKIETLVEMNMTDVDVHKCESFGDYAEWRYVEYFKDYPEITDDLYEPLLHSLNLAEMMSDSGDTWYDISIKGLQNYAECGGDQNNNWKNRTYSFILDILMKKYPNPDEELPVIDKTNKNSKVMEINYNDDFNYVKVSTVNGKEFIADHVIFTPSLGVLKENYQQLFNPPLPKNKITAINEIGFGHVAKIWLYYDNPWWDSNDNKFIVNPILWTNEDRLKIKFDRERKWMLGVYGVLSVEHKPKLLCLWMASDYSKEMEYIPEDIFQAQVTELLKKFYGRFYRVTKPTKIKRSLWNTNENFLGTYSYQSVSADSADVNYSDLAEPIMRDNKPIIQFAGEATSEHYATVHGAIDSGWREADRLIDLYGKKSKKDLSPLLKKFLVNSAIKIH